MRIDRSDLADGPNGAHIARRARSAPDDPGATGKDEGKAVSGDAPRDSSVGGLDSALRIERTAAYRAAVDDAYRQYAIDHGYARVEKFERETVIPAMQRTEAEDPERLPAGSADQPAVVPELEYLRVPDGTEHESRIRDRSTDFYVVPQLISRDTYPCVPGTTPVLNDNADRPGSATIGTVTDEMLTGARGPASGREFDPEAAGGPIQQLDAGKARITSEGVQEATAHLQRFAGGGPLEVPEQAMLDRLTSIAAGDMEPTSYDLNFYTHELDEAARYAQLGFGPESGADLGSPEMYDVWNDVHTAALEDYGISGADLFYPELAP